MKQNSCRVTAAYSLLQMSSWIFYSVMMAFSSNVLYSFGFQGGHVSILLGTATAFSFIFQLTAAEAVTRSKKLKAWAIILAAGVVLVICNFLSWFPGSPVYLAVGSYAIGCVVLQMLPTMANAVGMEAIRRGAPANFGVARGMGSLAYALMVFLTGQLVRSHGSMVVPLIAMFNAFLLIFSILFFHRCAECGLPESEPVSKKESKSGFLRQYPQFGILLLGIIILLIGHNMPGQFMYQIMQSKNGTAADQGIAMSIAAFMEIPIMFAFPLIARKAPTDVFLRLSTLFFAVKNIGILLADRPQGVFMVVPVQMLGFGLYTMASVNYAEQVVGKGESVRAQSYLGATAVASCLVASSTGGFLCQYMGPQFMVFVSLLCNLIGATIIWISVRNFRKTRNSAING